MRDVLYIFTNLFWRSWMLLIIVVIVLNCKIIVLKKSIFHSIYLTKEFRVQRDLLWIQAMKIHLLYRRRSWFCLDWRNPYSTILKNQLLQIYWYLVFDPAEKKKLYPYGYVWIRIRTLVVGRYLYKDDPLLAVLVLGAAAAAQQSAHHTLIVKEAAKKRYFWKWAGH